MYIGNDGYQIAGVAVDVHDLIVEVRKGNFCVGEALDGEPVAEAIQFLGVACAHGQISLSIYVQINISQVQIVVFKVMIYRVAGKGLVVQMDVFRRDLNLVAQLQLWSRLAGLVKEVPVCHAVRILDAVEKILTLNGIVSVLYPSVRHGLRLDRLDPVISVIVQLISQSDGGTSRGDDRRQNAHRKVYGVRVSGRGLAVIGGEHQLVIAHVKGLV